MKKKANQKVIEPSHVLAQEVAQRGKKQAHPFSLFVICLEFGVRRIVSQYGLLQHYLL